MTKFAKHNHLYEMKIIGKRLLQNLYDKAAKIYLKKTDVVHYACSSETYKVTCKGKHRTNKRYLKVFRPFEC